MTNRREEIEARLYQLSVHPRQHASVAAMHEVQRHAPPAPYQRALERRGVLPQAASKPVVDRDGVPKGWSTALQRRAAEEGR